MATKRKLELVEESEDSEDSNIAETDKLKRTIISIAQDHTCPLSLELMVDPVTAEDGYHYERKWIEKTIKTQSTNLRSPMTSEKMGPRLFPTARLASTIESLVKSGAVEKGVCDIYNKTKLVFDTQKEAARGDVEAIKLLGSWYGNGSHGFSKDTDKSKMLLDKATGLHMKKRAEDGNAEAMCDLGNYYYYGSHSFSTDKKLSYEWFKKSSDLMNPHGMAEAGFYLLEGIGVAKNVAHGMSLIGVAAGMGSQLACYRLGMWHHEGVDGLPRDKKEAKYWLGKVVSESRGRRLDPSDCAEALRLHRKLN